MLLRGQSSLGKMQAYNKELSSKGHLHTDGGNILLIFLKNLSLYFLNTSDYCVVEKDEDDEGGVEEGEGDEELVEGVAHLPGGQDRH